jgi:hypothetical protein
MTTLTPLARGGQINRQFKIQSHSIRRPAKEPSLFYSRSHWDKAWESSSEVISGAIDFIQETSVALDASSCRFIAYYTILE